MPRYTEHSPSRIEDLLKEVEKARELGYATDLEEYRVGVRAIAALVFRGRVSQAAISIFGLAGSMDDERLPEMIRHMANTAQLISNKLTLMTRGVNESEGSPSARQSAGSDA